MYNMKFYICMQCWYENKAKQLRFLVITILAITFTSVDNI